MRSLIAVLLCLVVAPSAAIDQARMRQRGRVRHVPPSGLTALTSSNVTYDGGFTLPNPSGSCGTADTVPYGWAFDNTFGLAYYAAGNGGAGSLFLNSVANLVGEISIPALTLSSNVATWTRATKLHDCIDPTEGKLGDVITIGGGYMSGICSGSPGVCLGGMLVIGSQLCGTIWIYYDGSGDQRYTHYCRPVNLNTTGLVKGLYNVGSLGVLTGRVSGYIAAIPAGYQGSLGGTAASGNFGISIVSRSSYGPAFYAFNDADLTGAAGTSVSASDLLHFDISHTAGPNHSASNVWNEATGNAAGAGLVIPTNHSSALFVYSQGIGPYCYGEGQNGATPTVSADTTSGSNASTSSNGLTITLPNKNTNAMVGADIALTALTTQTPKPDIGDFLGWDSVSGTQHLHPYSATITGAANSGTASASVTVADAFPGSLTSQAYNVGIVTCNDPAGVGFSKGEHSYPYKAVGQVYALSDLAAVKAGSMNPYDLVPTSTFYLSDSFLNTPNSGYFVGVGGVAYDPTNQRLFVIERRADTDGVSAVTHRFTIS